MSDSFTLAAIAMVRTEVRKSRFLAAAGPVRDESEAKAFIAAHSNFSATHNCSAWRIGQAYRFDDDGEPAGTAGKPILQAIDGQGLDRVAVVVTRWFGGILLGGGGLVRAYGGAAAQCLRQAEKLQCLDLAAALVACDFGDLAILTARLAAIPGLETTGQEFTPRGALIEIAIPVAERARVERLVADVTSGRGTLTWRDDAAA
ncbi:YigZ family protein [Aureimonas sp. OT7]|uniref:IMPACT family protein n=1 Tax=Aureimonas sp. OT7 TaxID=2816454 RepID=UPI00177F50C2|nr:YigZ family protein [Aureimonas sp. OT7]QOG07611.1 YigZ family protein [Aureimonas sp. OT7]